MFSGKTEELIRRLKRAKFARQRVEIFKPALDTRYSEEEVVSHDSNSIASTPIDTSASILLFSSDKDVIGIDEAQFFRRRVNKRMQSAGRQRGACYCSRTGYGFQKNSVRTYSGSMCHCR